MPINLPTRHLVSQNDAAIIAKPHVQRSRFTGSWDVKTAFQSGLIIPFMCDEVIPGDHMQYRITPYVRISTPLFPMFSNQRVDVFVFYVPNRILWDNWTKFMGAQATPASSIEYSIPEVTGTAGGQTQFGIYDYYGLPVNGQITAGLSINFNALPFRAYNKIYNDWFRDENLVDSRSVPLGDGPDTAGTYVLQRRAKSHDYFTSMLPWPQKFTAPTVPLGTTAPIKGLAINAGVVANVGSPGGNQTGAVPTTSWLGYYDASVIGVTIEATAGAAVSSPAVYADLAAAAGISINTLRQAWMVQTLLENDARGGTRYTEIIQNHFGVTVPDFRLQRAEYIGGGQHALNLTPIAQTAPTAGVPLGALGAAGTASGDSTASYAVQEHGYIIGLINVRSELSYQQGLHRMWTRRTRYDFPWPELTGLGEQAVLVKELYCKGNGAAGDDVVLGYQERYAEYRQNYSQVTGIMRSTSTGTLDAWHLGQRHTVQPALNQTFIEDSPPMSRVLAGGAGAVNQEYLADIFITRNATRPLPAFGTPISIGRF